MDDILEMPEVDDFEPSYDPPIAVAYGKAVAEYIDNMVFRAVQNVMIDVDREKLEQALTQDRARYDEAYQRGFTHGWTKGWRDAKEETECEET